MLYPVFPHPAGLPGNIEDGLESGVYGWTRSMEADTVLNEAASFFNTRQADLSLDLYGLNLPSLRQPTASTPDFCMWAR